MKELTPIEATEAWLAGKEIEIMAKHGWEVVVRRNSWSSANLPYELFDGRFRLKPSMKIIPWRNPKDIPSEARFVRHPSRGHFDLIVPTDNGLLMHVSEGYIVDHGVVRWCDLGEYMWSYDRLRWNPCTIEITE